MCTSNKNRGFSLLEKENIQISKARVQTIVFFPSELPLCVGIWRYMSCTVCASVWQPSHLVYLIIDKSRAEIADRKG